MKSRFSAWCLAMMVLSACGGEADEYQDDSEEPAEIGAVSEALARGGTRPTSCVDRCLSLCPKDTRGGIEAACGLQCLSACSATRATTTASASTVGR